MKVNVFKNRRIDQTPVTESFTSERTGEVYTLTLFRLDDLQLASAQDFGDLLVQRHVLGGFVDQSGEFKKAPDLWMLDDSPIEVSEGSMRLFAVLERMQGIKRGVFEDAIRESGYLAQELAIIAVTEPEVWEEIKLFRRRVQAGALDPKAQGEPDGTSSTQASEPARDISPSLKAS